MNDYIALEKLRFGDKVAVNLKLEGDVEQLNVPPLLIIPFVENCFKHGLSLDGVLVIKIHVAVKEKSLLVVIENPIKHKTEVQKGGIGISNTRRRLELLYGNDFELEASRVDEKFIVKLRLNLSKDGLD